jgi:hypothetical protein
MPDLIYPFHFQCTNCGERLTIERADVEEVSDDPDSIDALTFALEEGGWVRSYIGVLCPDCATRV